MRSLARRPPCSAGEDKPLTEDALDRLVFGVTWREIVENGKCIPCVITFSFSFLGRIIFNLMITAIVSLLLALLCLEVLLLLLLLIAVIVVAVVVIAKTVVYFNYCCCLLLLVTVTSRSLFLLLLPLY